uniref:Enoyl CoA hydratase domain-containing protein 1 n=1 Tax=Sphaerodactylus townsendi TaxID=933632 RepID=A0ACB8GCR3_9SAUR
MRPCTSVEAATTMGGRGQQQLQGNTSRQQQLLQAESEKSCIAPRHHFLLDGMNMCMFMQNTLTRLMRLPLITVAVIQGKALGGGAELTTACDFRLMTPESEIRFVHKQMGLVPGWGGAARLVQIVGSSPALKLLSGAVKVLPEHALHIGLIEAILSSSDEPLEETCTWLKLHTKGPAEVIQAVKKVVVAGRELPLEAALRTEMKIFGTVWGGPANLEALAQRTKHT